MTDLEIVKELSDTAYQFLSSFNPEQFEDGRVELENGLYVNIESYETQVRSMRRYEAHRSYIDIQFMIHGEEIITVAPVSELNVLEPYDAERDIEFYESNTNGMDYSIRSGEFLIFRPGDAHMPCIALNGRQVARKAVVKVPIL